MVTRSHYLSDLTKWEGSKLVYSLERFSRILVTGGHGFLGRWVIRSLKGKGVPEARIFAPRSAEYDFRNYADCMLALKDVDAVVHLAARVGGIGYHLGRESQMFMENALMGLNLMQASQHSGVDTFLTVGTACSYPSEAPLPLTEESLFSGLPSGPTAFYGMAKRILAFAGQAMQNEMRCLYVIPTNLYGPGDVFDDKTSHVIPSLVKRFSDAKVSNLSSLKVWGNPNATRDFLYVGDAASIIITLLERGQGPEPINAGSGRETTIAELAQLVRKLVYGKTPEPPILYDHQKPVGTERRLLSYEKALKLGWSPTITLEQGLEETVSWYEEQRSARQTS